MIEKRQIKSLLQQYLQGDQNNEGRTPTAREASFDYCFNYFQKFRGEQRIHELAAEDNLESSCLHLAFYLASWGMFRGSSFLIKQSLRHFVPVVRKIAETPAEIWDLDICNANPKEVTILMDLENAISEKLAVADKKPTVTLTTKAMLGVFGNVPAIDTFVYRGLQRSLGYSANALDHDSAAAFARYYREHKSEFDDFSIHSLDFLTQEETSRQYPISKKVDMALFMLGR